MKLDGGDSNSVNNMAMIEMTTKYRTRMKKVAPPPPPPGGTSADQRPPLTNGDLLRRQSSHEAPPIIHHHSHHPVMNTTPGEDCAFDELLEGRMELEVVLPDNKTVRMTVDRRTPMMDLLVHAATANKISPGGHVIRVVPKIAREQQQQEEEDHHHPRDVPYKPNTPVGSLDVSTVHIVPKPHPDIPVRRMPKLANQPFEQTFRLQVNLPRNQRMVLRVSPRITLAELKRQICNEKELDHSSHHLVHPAQPDTVLDLNSSLELYGCAEISLMSNSGLRDSIRSTSTHLIGYPRVEDEKKKKGIMRLFSKKKKETTVETNTNGLGSRGVSPTRNLTTSNRESYQPKQSTKRKPAPAPPPPAVQPQQPPSPSLVIQSSSSISSKPESEISAKTDELGSTVSHSRHSSDSSGYHEPSVFSDCSQENKSPEASIVQGGGGGGLTTSNVLCTPSKDVVPPDSLPLVSRQTTPVKEQLHATSLSNLKTVPCCSNTSIVSASRKRKAPQPPAPPVLQEVETPSSPEDVSPLTTSKSILENQTVVSRESAPVADSNLASNDSEPTENEEESTMTHPTPAQTPETTRQENEAITYLENVLKESETATKSPTHLSPKLDKRVDDDNVAEKSSVETNVSTDKLADDDNVGGNDENDSCVIETNGNIVPSAYVPRLESPLDDPSSFPAVYTSAEDDVNADAIEVSSGHTIASLDSASERLSVDGDKNNEDVLSILTDTSESPSVPLNKDILPQTEASDSIVENSMQPGSQNHNFVQDFKVKSGDQNLLKEIECDDSSSKTCENVISKPDSVESAPSQLQLCVEPQLIKSETVSDVKVSENQMAAVETDEGFKESAETPKAHRKLANFALGCYKSDNKDIYDDKQEVSSEQLDSNCSTEKISDTKKELNKPDVSLKYRRQAPEVKIVPFEERSKTDSDLITHSSFKGQVQKRCSELSEMSTLPLTGRSSSLHNLTPQKRIAEERIFKKPLETVHEGLKRTQSDQNLSQEMSVAEEKLDFIQEQKRLHEEYLKLQAQFISWQKQLLNNQSLLQNEQVMPQMMLLDLEQYKIQLETLPKALQLNDKSVDSKDETSEELKTRSLPRQKSPSLPAKNAERPSTPLVCQIPKVEEPLTLPKLQASTPDEQNETNSLIVKNGQDETVIYAQVNKLKKTIKTDTNSNVNTVESSDNELSKSPEIPKKQSVVNDNSKSQTLPRQKTQPISAFEASRTMTLNRQARPKPQVVAVTIGSWKQRNQAAPDISSASVASSRSMFQSLENIPCEPAKATGPTSIETKKITTSVSPASDKKDRQIPDVVTAKVIVKKDGKDIVEDDEERNKAGSKELTHPKTKVSEIIEVQKQHSKPETKPAAVESRTSHSKTTKPLVLLSSMKDDTRPPPIQVLKKWPLSNINEKESPQKTGERSIWSELKASAKRPSGSTKERVTRAEVDLRKHRTQKSESSSKSPKSQDAEQSTSKLHISKVDVNIENKSNDRSKPSETSAKSKPTVTASEKPKKTFPASKSEVFSAELKDVLLKRASSLTECQDSVNNHTESNYAELNGGDNNVQTKTVAANDNSPPPPPPPPLSTMPTIPPAAPIPKSSQLLMDKRTRDSQTKVKTSNTQSKTRPRKDPREELMLEIRGFGGRQALRKAPTTPVAWNLKVYGTASSLKS